MVVVCGCVHDVHWTRCAVPRKNECFCCINFVGWISWKFHIVRARTFKASGLLLPFVKSCAEKVKHQTNKQKQKKLIVYKIFLWFSYAVKLIPWSDQAISIPVTKTTQKRKAQREMNERTKWERERKRALKTTTKITNCCTWYFVIIYTNAKRQNKSKNWENRRTMTNIRRKTSKNIGITSRRLCQSTHQQQWRQRQIQEEMKRTEQK